MDIATSLAVSPDGTRVYVTGESESVYYSADYATVAYDAMTGAKVWVRRYDGPGGDYDSAASLAVSPDGATVFVTGQSQGADPETEYGTVAYDAASGGTLWVRRYDGPGGDYDSAASLAVSPDGATVYVTGTSDGEGTGQDYGTVAYETATGARLWVARYNGPGQELNKTDNALSLAVSPYGDRVYVTGTSLGPNGGDYATVAYDSSTGGEVWVSRYDGLGHGYDIAHSIAVSPDGEVVYVTGSSEGTRTGDDYVSVAHDAVTGAQVWVRRYNGPGDDHDAAYSLAMSADGDKVYVTGSSHGSGGSDDYATVSYDAITGTKLWVRRYFGPGHGADSAFSVAASPDGASVYVTGFSWGSGTGYEFAAVAYAA